MKIDKDSITLITAISGAALGLLGAVLGVVNTWRAFDRDRIRLKITPVWIIVPDRPNTLGIVIINQSYIAVTVSEVGFRLRDRSKRFVYIAKIPGVGHLPQRMEPRTEITAFAPPGTENDEPMRDVRCAYAKTACGRSFTGNSPALREVVATARKTSLVPKKGASIG